MKRIPRPVLRALEALAQSPINTSALAMAEGQDFAHDTLYRALNQPLASFFELSLELCKAMGGLDRGYLILDDVLIQRYRSGKLGLKKARDTSTGAWVFGLSLVVLALDGREAADPPGVPALLRGRESKLDLALALLEWAKEAGFRPEGVLFDAGTRRGRSWSGSMPTAGLLSRGSGLTVCWTVFSSGGMGVPVG
jgi:putative transposase